MNIQSSNYEPVYPGFKSLPEDIQEENLVLIKKVNEQHLHCEDNEVWTKAHYLITKKITEWESKKQQKRLAAAAAKANRRKGSPAQQINATPQVNPKPQVAPAQQTKPISHLNQSNYNQLLKSVKRTLSETFKDPIFTNPIIEALQQHILTPLSDHLRLAELLCNWIKLNAMYLPLGSHLLGAYLEDMSGISSFAKGVMMHQNLEPLPEALSQTTIEHMKAFLSEAAQSHCRSYITPEPRGEQLTAIMLSIKNGAGGHTAPTQAMAARLKERGWKVETINYDEHLSAECDPFQLLGITFEDGSPMTEVLYGTRWIMQKHNQDVSRIVKYYIGARVLLAPNLFVNDSGGDLLRKKILPLNPHLLITTLAYHWSWKSLAYRVTGAKTILAASDVFFHSEAVIPWLRQKSIDSRLRQIHFTSITDDIDLLKSIAVHHDSYYINKYPKEPLHSMLPLYKEMSLDDQISVIGAPIHPAFDAITNLKEIKALREKWGVPDGTMSICISRGKLGYETDLIPALEAYWTHENLPQPIILQVVCGENTPFYKRLLAGEYQDLGPNITIKPHLLLKPREFAQLRAISLDDIKAGGGSTFEGWYLISKGIPSMLLLTPGKELWWERSNCDAMEKWGIGRTFPEKNSKIEIIEQVMQKGFPSISHPFPDWKPPFDRIVDLLAKEKNDNS